jgi:uncharacterized protein involved in exopolysaccharide biosynthesis
VVDIAIQTYSDLSVENSKEQVKGALSFLDNEMESVNTKLQEAESDLLSFMNREKVVQLDNQTTNLISSVSTLMAERQASELRTVSVNTSIGIIRDQLANISPDIISQISNAASQRVSGLQTALAKVETDKVVYQSLNPNATDRDNNLTSLNNQINRLRSEIASITTELVRDDLKKISFLGSADGNLASQVTTLRENLMALETEKAQLDAKMSIINQRLNEQENQFKAIPENMMELARRQRELEMNEKLYSLVSQQAVDASLWEQTQQGSGRVVDLAEYPTYAVSPQQGRIYALFSVGGFLLSLGFIFLRTTFNNTVNTIEDLEDRKSVV